VLLLYGQKQSYTVLPLSARLKIYCTYSDAIICELVKPELRIGYIPRDWYKRTFRSVGQESIVPTGQRSYDVFAAVFVVRSRCLDVVWGCRSLSCAAVQSSVSDFCQSDNTRRRRQQTARCVVMLCNFE